MSSSLSGNTGLCTLSDSLVYRAWIEDHKPRSVSGTWIDPFSTEAWWNSNNGNQRSRRDDVIEHGLSGVRHLQKRQLDCSSSSTPGVCLRDSGRLLCYSATSGIGIYEDGYELNFVTGAYVTDDGEKGNVQYGPCPGDVYEEEEDGRRCVRSARATTSSEDSTTASATSTQSSTSSTTTDSGAAAGLGPAMLPMVLAVGALALMM